MSDLPIGMQSAIGNTPEPGTTGTSTRAPERTPGEKAQERITKAYEDIENGNLRAAQVELAGARREVAALEQERRVIRNIGLKGLSDVDEILNIIEGALEHVLSRRSWIKEQLAVARQACDRFTEKLIATEAVTKPEGER